MSFVCPFLYFCFVDTLGSSRILMVIRLSESVFDRGGAPNGSYGRHGRGGHVRGAAEAE